MRYLYTLLLLGLSLQGYSQTTWCSPGAKWTYTWYGVADGGTSIIRYEKDTIIGSELCKKLALTHYSVFSFQTGSPLFTFERNDTVFFSQEGTAFWPTYFFNVAVGDTVLFRNPYDPFASCDSFHTMVVDSIDTLHINGEFLKYYRIKVYNDSGTITAYPNPLEVVEKFGALNSIMIPEFDCSGIIDLHYYDLRCYSDSTFPQHQLQFNFDCDWIPTDITENREVEVTLYPNPATNTLYISNLTQPAIITLYSLTGQRVLQEQLDAGHGQTDVSDLSSGMYIYHVEHGILTSGKILKE